MRENTTRTTPPTGPRIRHPRRMHLPKTLHPKQRLLPVQGKNTLAMRQSPGMHQPRRQIRRLRQRLRTGRRRLRRLRRTRPRRPTMPGRWSRTIPRKTPLLLRLRRVTRTKGSKPKPVHQLLLLRRILLRPTLPTKPLLPTRKNLRRLLLPRRILLQQRNLPDNRILLLDPVRLRRQRQLLRQPQRNLHHPPRMPKQLQELHPPGTRNLQLPNSRRNLEPQLQHLPTRIFLRRPLPIYARTNLPQRNLRAHALHPTIKDEPCPAEDSP